MTVHHAHRPLPPSADTVRGRSSRGREAHARRLRRRAPPVVAIALLMAGAAGCGGSEPVPPPLAGALDEPLPEPAGPAPGGNATGGGEGEDASPLAPGVEPADPLATTVALDNPGAERAVDGEPAVLAGWETRGDCRRDTAYVAAGRGRASFALGAGCTLAQTGAHRLAAGEGLSLVLDVASTAGGDTALLVELYAEADDGRRRTLGARRIALPATHADWQSRQLLLRFGAADAAVGERLGLRLVNDSAGGGSVALDALALSAHAPDASRGTRFAEDWVGLCDQAWAGAHWWANRLHDWEVRGERLRTRDGVTHRPMRTVHRVTTIVREAPADFSLSVATGVDEAAGAGAWSGLLLGAGHRLDHRGAALVHNRHGRNGGLVAGIDAEGRAFVHDNGVDDRSLATGAPSAAASAEGATLRLDARYRPDGNYLLNVFALDADGATLSSASTLVAPERVLGNLALASHPGARGTTHWFARVVGFGAKLRELPGRAFGPVLFASHTLSRGTLTLNAQYPQSCAERFDTPRLEAYLDGGWRAVASAAIDPLSLTARFSVDDWDDTADVPYRVATDERRDGESRTHHYAGTVRRDPTARDALVLATYNCRPGVILSDTEGWIQQNNAQPFTWTRERIVLPHEELVTNSAAHGADLLAFLGDQLYEFDPNGFIDKEDTDNLVDDYFWKWYQFGWAVRELMRDTPAIVIPDDHDVFQGNVWGQGGRMADTEEAGGFVHPAEFVQIVRRTQAGSLPAPFDPTPLEQGIDVYYTDLVYGGVGIAVLEDRTFKSGPQSPVEPKRLLGERQHAFLDAWARDWRGQTMKLALSQSPFSQSTTHSGARFARIGIDRDSNGWPKAGRDEAVRALRRAFAPHVTGDQHLGMVLRHGIERAGDGVYSFAGPSMLNIFPRIWDPRNAGDGPGDRALGHLGSWTDRHGNLIDVLAAANPDVYYAPLAPGVHAPKDALGIGYGIVRVEKAARRYVFEAWPANADPTDPLATPYPEWPVAVAQADNDGRPPAGTLPARVAAVAEPVVEVVDENTGELVWVRRLPDASVTLPVPDAAASYRVTLSDPATGYEEVFTGQRVVR